MALIQHFESYGLGARISIRGLGEKGPTLAEALLKRKGRRVEISFEVCGTERPIVVATSILDSSYQQWEAEGVTDSELDLWLEFEDEAGSVAVRSLFQSGSSFGMVLGD